MDRLYSKKDFLFLGIVFRTISYVERTLATLDKDIDIVMLECLSPETPNIGSRLKSASLKRTGKFRHILYSENLIGEAYRKFLRENTDVFENYSFLVVSDMDVEFECGTDWLAMMQAFDLEKDVGIISLLCSDINHQPEFYGYGSIVCRDEKILQNGLTIATPQGLNTGLQAVMMRTDTARKFFIESPTIPVIDSQIGLWLEQHEKLKWLVCSQYRVIHLMWYAYGDAKTQPIDVQQYLLFKQPVGQHQWNRIGTQALVLHETTYIND
jgi:hypothetical protein